MIKKQYTCPFCNGIFTRLGSHIDKCDKKPNDISDKEVEALYIKTNYGDILTQVVNDYENNYSLPMLKEKYNIPVRKIFTILDIYGCKHRTISEGVKNIAIKKMQDSCMRKYGVKNYVETAEFSNKSKATCMYKYGVDNVSKDENIKNKKIETCQKHFGVDHPFQSKTVMEKAAQTCIERYGVDNVVKLDINKQKTHSLEANLKRTQTKTKNKSFKTSKPEEQCYNLLLAKYPDCKRQYSSDVYSYNCDFYIPSKDLYIEYNGSHYHHYHPYDSTNENDVNELNNLIERSNKLKQNNPNKKNQYDYIIYTWTQLDVNKRNLAKTNKLNFIEFWNINEVKKWLE